MIHIPLTPGQFPSHLCPLPTTPLTHQPPHPPHVLMMIRKGRERSQVRRRRRRRGINSQWGNKGRETHTAVCQEVIVNQIKQDTCRIFKVLKRYYI